MNDANSIGQWVLAAGVILSILLNLRKLSGRVEQREITPQPLMVKQADQFAPLHHDHPAYLTIEDHSGIASNCIEERRRLQTISERDRAEVRKEIADLGNTIRSELARHSHESQERSDAIHSRVSSLLGPLEATRARLDDHIHNHPKRIS
jgi:hypothetical protein